MNTPVLWITIPRRYDRGHFFFKWNISRFPGIRFKQVDGVDPINHRLRSTGGSLTHGQAGCWLGHFIAWQVGLAMNPSGVVILEDDVKILPGFEDEVSRAVGACVPTSLDPERPSCTYAYYMPGWAMEFLLSANLTRDDHIDHQIWKLFNRRGVASSKVVTHCHDEILSETCEFTWSAIHKEAA